VLKSTVKADSFSGVWCSKDWCRQLVLLEEAFIRIRGQNPANLSASSSAVGEGDFLECYKVISCILVRPHLDNCTMFLFF
jgi:hypothetical protein